MLAVGKTKWAGIGSRVTPIEILRRMKFLSKTIASHGLVLRSGGAKGADRAFEEAYPKELCEIYLKHHADEASMEIASRFHPKWSACDEYARNLHGRNAKIILGDNLDDPVDFVVCWTIDGKASGGTGTGIRIAKSKQIPVFNLYHKDDYWELIHMLAYWDMME